MESYAILDRAQIGYDYLHTNSTTHEFLFGAIAELIDNSRDAGATELDIYTIKDSSVRGNFLLCFADNGCGMSPEETRSVIIFGKSCKKSEESTSIGMYGNGLKSCQKDFYTQFDKLKDESGTLVIVYNMKLLDHGAPELDILSNPRDILLASNPEQEEVEPDAEILVPPERRSLRAYVSILYSDPRMKVYLQGRKVHTKRLLSTLFETRKYNFASKTFRTRAEADLSKAKNDVKVAELRAQEAESKARDCELRFQGSEDPDHLRQVRRLRVTASEYRTIVAQRQKALARKQKAIKDPKTLTFYFGVNVMNRACDGMFVYNCSRLIKMYQRIGPQQDSSMMCRGVVGIVDVPYMVLEPTHNKQDFADAKEYRQLMRAMADHLMQYWDDLGLDKQTDSLFRFWKSFGYLSARWRDPPSNDEKFARRRCCSVSICVQCDKCLKWRILPFSQSLVGRELPDNWQCRDNADHRHKKCADLEEDMSPLIGVLKRKIKSKEQRQAELEKQIKKKQEELEMIKDPDDSDEEEESDSDEEPQQRPTSSRKAKVPSPRKRPAPASNPPPNKRPTTSSASTSRGGAVTVADKRRAVANGSTNDQRKSSATVSTSAQAKSRAPVANQGRRTSRASPSGSDESSEDEQPAKKSAAKTAAQEKRLSSDVRSGASTKAATVQNSSDRGRTDKPTSSTARESRSSTATPASTTAIQRSNGLPSRATTTTNGNPDSTSTGRSADSVNSEAISKSIQEKFKVCLRYFLPPEWPMEKDQIHTISEQELVDFPLENFFDRYEQGLRSLLSTYQQEAKAYVDRLADIRGNVVRLITKLDPTLVNPELQGDQIDQLLSDYLQRQP